MDKIKGTFPIRPSALIRKKVQSRIIKFTGDAQGALKSSSSSGFLSFVKEYFEMNKRLFTGMVSFFEDLFSGDSKKRLSKAPVVSDKEAGPLKSPLPTTPRRKAVIISIETASNYE